MPGRQVEFAEPANCNLARYDKSAYMPTMTLKKLIRSRGKLQRWLARRVDMTEGRFSRIVHGHYWLPLRSVPPLARALGVSVEAVVRAAIETHKSSGQSADDRR